MCKEWVCWGEMLLTVQALFRWFFPWWPFVYARASLLEMETVGLPEWLPLPLYVWQRKGKSRTWSRASQISRQMALSTYMWYPGLLPCQHLPNYCLLEVNRVSNMVSLFVLIFEHAPDVVTWIHSGACFCGLFSSEPCNAFPWLPFLFHPSLL